MRYKEIKIGEYYNNLMPTGNYEIRKNNNHTIGYYECLCKCGNIVWIKTAELNNGAKKSCGCLNKQIYKDRVTTHGLSKSKIYKGYHRMVSRCTNENDACFQRYGGRGITVCDEWLGDDGFINFYNWSKNNGFDDYKELSLDRIDNDKGYSPDNCRWADIVTQANNTRRNVFVTYNGETKTVSQWAKYLGIKSRTLHTRLFTLNMPIEKAFTMPIQKHEKEKK